MITIITLGVILLSTCVLIHFEGLTAINRFIAAHRRLVRTHLVLVILFILAMHLLEIVIFSGGYFIAHHVLELGSFQGEREFALIDYFHFSAETYTSVGYGDLYPVGPIRVLSSLEGLTGLLLLAWSGTYSYFTVQKLWDSGH